MIFVYVRMYRAATTQMNALKTGQKLNCKTADGKPLILRIHRGGTKTIDQKNSNIKTNLLSPLSQKSSRAFELSKSLECVLISNLTSMGPFTSSFSSIIQNGPPKPITRSCSLQNIESEHFEKLTKVKQDRVSLGAGIKKKMKISLLEPSGSFEHKKYEQTKKYLNVYFDGSSKKLLKFYNNHYYGHTKLMSDIKLSCHKTNKMSKHGWHESKSVRAILKSIRSRCKRADSNFSNVSNFSKENENKMTHSLAIKVKGLSLAKKLKKFTKEQKAAKTLGNKFYL